MDNFKIMLQFYGDIKWIAIFNLGVANERTSCPPRNTAPSRRRNKNRDGSSSSPGSAESTVLDAELVRRVVPEPCSQRRDNETWAKSCLTSAMVGVCEEVQSRNVRARGQARPGTPGRAIAHGRLLSGLLLPARRPLPPFYFEAASYRERGKVRVIVLPKTMTPNPSFKPTGNGRPRQQALWLPSQQDSLLIQTQ